MVSALPITGLDVESPPVPAWDRDGFRPYVQALGRGETLRRDLTRAEAQDALDRILAGTVSPAQAGAFFIAQRVKGESRDEIRGFVDAVRARWLTPVVTRQPGVLDLAVPYDGKERTAQLAPAVALVLAACGQPVLLHGAAAVPTKEGVTPADVLSALGVATYLSPAAAAQVLDQTGIAYCDAQAFMPAWVALMPLRREFGLRTVLNTVEKLVNPADADFQVSGFYHTKYIDEMRDMQTGRQDSWIVQGEEGSIEMRAGRKTRLFGRNRPSPLVLDPEALGFPQRAAVAAGRAVTQHAALNRQALENRDTAARAQVAMTSGVLLALLGRAATQAAGISAAAACLAAGRAHALLNDFRTATRTH